MNRLLLTCSYLIPGTLEVNPSSNSAQSALLATLTRAINNSPFHFTIQRDTQGRQNEDPPVRLRQEW